MEGSPRRENRPFVSFWHVRHPCEDVLCVVEEFRVAVGVTVAVVSDGLDEFCLFLAQFHLDFVSFCHGWYLL